MTKKTTRFSILLFIVLLTSLGVKADAAPSLNYGAFDVSTATFDSIALDVSLQETTPTDMTFNNDGTKLYVIGTDGDDVNQYDLSAPYDISTGVFNSIVLDVAPEDLAPASIAFNNNGTSLYIVGFVGDDINKYSIDPGNYSEAIANDGTIDNSNPLTIILTQETFQDIDTDNILDIGTEVTIGNIPAGLTPVMTLSSGDTVVTLTFTAAATAHQNINDVTDLTFVFDDTAFTGGDASLVSNSGSAGAFSSNVGIDFEDNVVINQAPTDIQIDGANSDMVDENVTNPTTIGTLTTTDPDVADTHSYTLGCSVSGADDVLFQISGANLQTASVFDFENPIDANTDGTYEVCIRTTDSAAGNLTYDETITITINDLNNAPTDIAIDGGAVDSLDENTIVGTNIGSLTNTDDGEDNTESYSYTLGCSVAGADDTYFAIVGDGLQNTTVFDFENPVDANIDNTYEVCVHVTETNGGLIYEKNISIVVNDLLESSSSSGGSSGGSVKFICKDPDASNYNASKFRRHKQSRCEYKTLTEISQCPVFTQHMRKSDRDGQLGKDKQELGVSKVISEIKLLQSTLLDTKYNVGPIDGIFGNQTEAAVKKWQVDHKKEVLAPWGISTPTGRFYQSSERWMNELLGCQDNVTLDNGVVLK